MRYAIAAVIMLLSGCAYAGWDMAEPSYSTAQDAGGNLVARSYSVGKTTYMADVNGNYMGQVQPSSNSSSAVFNSDQQYVGQVNRSSHEIAPIPTIPTIPAIPR